MEEKESSAYSQNHIPEANIEKSKNIVFDGQKINPSRLTLKSKAVLGIFSGEAGFLHGPRRHKI